MKKLLTGKGGKVVDEKRWKSCCLEKLEKLLPRKGGKVQRISKRGQNQNPKKQIDQEPKGYG